MEAHINVYPSSASGWHSYNGLYSQIKQWASVLAKLSGQPVTGIPAKRERPAVVTVSTDDWLDEAPTVVDQPKWMATPESRRRHSEQIAAENANARAERMCDITGAGMVRNGK